MVSYSDAADPVIYVEFSKKMTNPLPHIADFNLSASGNIISVSDAAILDDDSLTISLSLSSTPTYKDTLLLNYGGINYAANDGGLLKKFDSLLISNNYPTPAEFIDYKLSPGGDILTLSFSKAMNDTSVHSEEFSFTKNENADVSISDAWLSETDNQMIVLELSEAIAIEDSNLLISYNGNRLMTYQFVAIEAFGPISIDNSTAIPHVIPGTIESEDFYENSGFYITESTDEGGGQNISWPGTDDYVDYYVDVEESGLYTMTYRIASNSSYAEFSVYMPLETQIDNVITIATGGWDIWDNQYRLVNLEAGDQLLRLLTIDPSYNLNWIKFESGNTIPPETTSTINKDNEGILIYPNPVSNGRAIQIDIYSATAGNLYVELYDMSGRKLDDLYTGHVSAGNNQLSTKEIDQSIKSGVYLLLIKGDGFIAKKVLQINQK